MGKVTKLHSKEDLRILKQQEKCIVFQGAKWCSACQYLKPYFKKLASQYANEIKFIYVDVEKLNIQYTVIPVFTTYYKGKTLNSVSGIDKSGLKKFLKELSETK